MLENEACNKIAEGTHPYSAAGRRLITPARYPNFTKAKLEGGTQTHALVRQLITLRTLLFNTEDIQYFTVFNKKVFGGANKFYCHYSGTEA